MHLLYRGAAKNARYAGQFGKCVGTIHKNSAKLHINKRAEIRYNINRKFCLIQEDTK